MSDDHKKKIQTRESTPAYDLLMPKHSIHVRLRVNVFQVVIFSGISLPGTKEDEKKIILTSTDTRCTRAVKGIHRKKVTLRYYR